MSPAPNAAKVAARARMAATGEKYTTALRHVLATHQDAPTGDVPTGALAYLTGVLAELHRLGWRTSEPDGPDFGQYEAFAGPIAGLAIHASRDENDEKADPDDATAVDVTKRLYLTALCPCTSATDDDFAYGGDTKQPPETIARELDATLGQTRLRRVQGEEQRSTTPCPICGDRYPADHLLANSHSAEPVCPACIFDEDQRYTTDVTHLAVQIDQLQWEDLSAPAGWDAVAAVLALSCGRNLGTRIENDLKQRGGMPLVMERWNSPMHRSWIWLPPTSSRHAAFAHLGAGATLGNLVSALEAHTPGILDQAKKVCRDAQVRWRDSIWPAAVAYAVAFTTQAHERDRHRKPLHVLASTCGLSEIHPDSFPVAGNPINVEGGLQEILEELLFPLLLGHGLHDMPHEEQRTYGAATDDDRRPRQRGDAHITDTIDRNAQLAVILGLIPGFSQTASPWDGAASTDNEADLGSTEPANDTVSAVRHEARLDAAATLYDAHGNLAVSADEAWERLNCWIPPNSAPHAIRQAQAYLTPGQRVELLLGPNRTWHEPVWVRLDIVRVLPNGTPADRDPAALTSDGQRHIPIPIREICMVRRAQPGAVLPLSSRTAAAAVDAADKG